MRILPPDEALAFEAEAQSILPPECSPERQTSVDASPDTSEEEHRHPALSGIARPRAEALPRQSINLGMVDVSPPATVTGQASAASIGTTGPPVDDSHRRRGAGARRTGRPRGEDRSTVGSSRIRHIRCTSRTAHQTWQPTKRQSAQHPWKARWAASAAHCPGACGPNRSRWRGSAPVGGRCR
jgi:hypothetical protein